MCNKDVQWREQASVYLMFLKLLAYAYFKIVMKFNNDFLVQNTM